MSSTNENGHRAWNHGRLIGPRPPLKPKHIWAIRTRLQHEGRTRDIALINAAIDTLRCISLNHWISGMDNWAKSVALSEDCSDVAKTIDKQLGALIVHNSNLER